MISSLFLTAFYRLPAIYPLRDFAEAGGLVSYGARRLYRPYPQGHTDLPVVQSSKLELVINRQTANMPGLTVPDKLLAEGVVTGRQ